MTNLHHVSHQCGGLGCAHHDLLGIPLGSKRMSEELGPDSPLVADLVNHLDTWRVADAPSLAAVRETLLRFIPRLPPLTGGLEALVWTAPTSLTHALEGLTVVRILPTCHPWRAISGFFDWPPDTLAELGPFSEAHERLLEEVGRRLGLGAPQLFVVWANSD